MNKSNRNAVFYSIVCIWILTLSASYFIGYGANNTSETQIQKVNKLTSQVKSLQNKCVWQKSDKPYEYEIQK